MWKANKFVTILLWVLALISVVLCAYAFIRCGNLNARTEQAEMMNAINPMFIWTYILIGLTALLAIVLPIPQVIQNPKSAIGIAVGILGFVLVVGIAYALASGAALPFAPGHAEVDESTIKFADVNIISTYIMLGAAIVVTVATSIWNVIKMR